MSANATDVIRAAIAAGDFAEAQRLWESYAGEIEAAIRAGQCSEAMMTEAGDLLQWARLMVGSHRTNILAQLYEARAMEAYIKSLL